jgi:hypothetical protein
MDETDYLDAVPELDEYEEIVEEYPHDTYLIRRDDPDAEGTTWRFETLARDPIEFDDEKRARLFADLFLSLGGFRIKKGVGERGIPLAVASEGKPAIAAYVYAVWEMPPWEIAKSLGLGRETVINAFEQIHRQGQEVIDSHESG